MALDCRLLLGEGEGQPRGHPDLLTDQVHTGDHLGDRVLHLDTGVHLNEIEVALRVQDELHCSGPQVAAAPGGGDGRLAHGLPQLTAEGVGGGFLHQLLVLALDGAVPLPQVDHVAPAVGHNLELNVPGVEDQLFHVQGAVAEAGLRLRLGGGKGLGQLLRGEHPSHAPAPAAGGGLEHHRIADVLRPAKGLLHVRHTPVGPGYHRHPGGLHHGPGGSLVPHGPDHVAGGANEGETTLLTEIRELCVFG